MKREHNDKEPINSTLLSSLVSVFRPVSFSIIFRMYVNWQLYIYIFRPLESLKCPVTVNPRVNPIKDQNLLMMMPVCRLSSRTVHKMAHRQIVDNKEGQPIAPPPSTKTAWGWGWRWGTGRTASPHSPLQPPAKGSDVCRPHRRQATEGAAAAAAASATEALWNSSIAWVANRNKCSAKPATAEWKWRRVNVITAYSICK